MTRTNTDVAVERQSRFARETKVAKRDALFAPILLVIVVVLGLEHSRSNRLEASQTEEACWGA